MIQYGTAAHRPLEHLATPAVCWAFAYAAVRTEGCVMVCIPEIAQAVCCAKVVHRDEEILVNPVVILHSVSHSLGSEWLGAASLWMAPGPVRGGRTGAERYARGFRCLASPGHS